MKTVKRRKRDAKFKERVVRLARESENVAASARELGLGYSLLHSWIITETVAESKGRNLSAAIEEQKETEKLLVREHGGHDENRPISLTQWLENPFVPPHEYSPHSQMNLGLFG